MLLFEAGTSRAQSDRKASQKRTQLTQNIDGVPYLQPDRLHCTCLHQPALEIQRTLSMFCGGSYECYAYSLLIGRSANIVWYGHFD
jgi:hypothetical protein